MRLISATSLVLVASLGLNLPASAEELQMPPESALPQQDTISLEMPIKGMSKEAVRLQYGEPNQTVPAVGDPPISRWVYGRYTVYFEGDYVIHSVISETRHFTK
jgi:hypothetical protein